METFDKYREEIEKELAAIIALMKTDPKIDSKNIFAVGFSNGGFWASYLAGKGMVTAAASHYGVWKACYGRDCFNDYPVKYFSSTSSPLLALHGTQDSTQKLEYYDSL
jgi:poly(3-hydroxybutyrate) depolymerase